MYIVDVDGLEHEDPFDVYCDMTTDGGWTLAMQFNGSGSIFTFNSTYWTDDVPLNETQLSPAFAGDAKHHSFALVEGDEIRGCLSRSVFSGCKDYPLPQTQTLLELFADTPVGSDSNGTGGLYFSESNVQR